MQKREVLQLIDEKLEQVEEAEKVNIWKGKISFGVHLHVYQHSPYLPLIIKKRKLIQRLILAETFLIPLIILTLSFGYADKADQSFWKAVVMVLVNALFLGGLFVYGLLRSLVRDTISAEKEVKKMMLHDLRQKVEALEVSDLAVHKTV